MSKLKSFTVFSLMLTVVFTSFDIFGTQNVFATNKTKRIAGFDRYSTAVEISKSGWEDGTGTNVVLATGEDFPDALAAAPLAKLLNAPILLVNGKSVGSMLDTELKRLQAKNIYIIGGDGVVSKDIEDKLDSEKYSVIRLAGSDRYGTSLKIANYIRNNFQTSKDVVVATGDNFPDALSIAPIAASKGMPILLCNKDAMSDGIKSYITDNKAAKQYVIGGTGVISDKVSQQLSNPVRIYGSDRYETNYKVITHFRDDINFGRIYAATGENSPDALAGSALAARSSSPVVLAYRNKAGLSLNDINIDINEIVALGGEGVMPQDTLQILVDISNNVPPVLSGPSNEIIYPKNGDIVDQGSITIRWNAVPGFDSYEVNINEQGTALGWHSSQTGTSFTAGPLMPDHIYHISVDAITIDGKHQVQMPTVTVTVKSSGNDIILSPVNNGVYRLGDKIMLDVITPPKRRVWDIWYGDVLITAPNFWGSYSTRLGTEIPAHWIGTPGKYTLMVIVKNDSTYEIIYSNKVSFTIVN